LNKHNPKTGSKSCTFNSRSTSRDWQVWRTSLHIVREILSMHNFDLSERVDSGIYTFMCVAHKKLYVEQTSVLSRRVSTQECSRKVHSQKFDWTYQPPHLLKLRFSQECACPIGNWYVGVRIQVVHVLLPFFRKGVAFYFPCSEKIASSFRDSL